MHLNKTYSLLIIHLFLYVSVIAKPKVTLDEFFNNTDFQLLSFSPTGQYLLIQTRHASWNTSTFEISLWIYNVQINTMKLITNKLATFSKPQWSPDGNQIVLLLNENPTESNSRISEHHLYLYSIISEQLEPISIGRNIPFSVVWSSDNSSLFFTAILLEPMSRNENEWKDVIQYRTAQTSEDTTIYRIDMDTPIKLTLVKKIPFFIGELVFVPHQHKLVFTSVSKIIEKLDVIEIYSIDVRNSTSMVRLTQNEGIEQDLKVSPDGTYILFRSFTLSSNRSQFSETFDQLFTLNLNNGQVKRYAKDFAGSITGYTIKLDGSILFVGQLGTEVQIYEQTSPEHNIVYHQGWNGTYALLSTSSQSESIVFVHSSFEKAKEVYLAENLNQLQSAQVITRVNELFTQRDLPQSRIYQWINHDDNRTIEGILRYPPGQFEEKQLPLLVLIHGGLYAASVNGFHIDWENWGVLAASEGWLVFEPNYRGSTGYGSQFINEVRYQFLSRPANDILSGIDQLIKDGIADSNRLAVGGYSYGGYLTNWLITQTTRFNAALSGAGAIEHSSEWGTIDLPVFEYYLLGGAPWEVPEIYRSEAAVYQLDKIRTPTHIITGQNDVRVNPAQSRILERALHYLEIPVQLLIFPNEDHTINNNPWHGKIKVREELKWLQKYGHALYTN